MKWVEYGVDVVMNGNDEKRVGRWYLLPTKIDFQSKLYHYEMLSAYLYDMLTHTNSSLFDKQNKPIYMCTKDKESNQK